MSLTIVCLKVRFLPSTPLLDVTIPNKTRRSDEEEGESVMLPKCISRVSENPPSSDDFSQSNFRSAFIRTSFSMSCSVLVLI